MSYQPYALLQQKQRSLLQQKEDITLLALETSCDETAAAIIKNGRSILSNVIFSQIDIHKVYGGVVPEIASRAHVGACDVVIDLALEQAGLTLAQIDGLAVTYGPGLVGALLTGVNCMKGLAYATGLPLVAVNHIEGHISANYLSHPTCKPPFLCLVVSGGHSHIIWVEDYATYKLLGQTQDDAAGEAFDKAARILGLPYPGGIALDQLAEEGDPHALPLPRPKTEGRYDFSFSGLKTAFINAVHNMEQKGERLPPKDLAASFRQAIVSSLCDKTMLAAKDFNAPAIALAGGVSANRLLRREMERLCANSQIPLYLPELSLCTDNAAMIGSAAYYDLQKGSLADLSLNANPVLRLI